MVENGYVGSYNEAFDRFLGKGALAYVDKFRLEATEAIHLVKRAGGIPVMAHPSTLGFHTALELEAFVAELIQRAGLMGIEVRYPEHLPEEEALYRHLANKYDLVMTGGTDYHGAIKPEIHLGWGRGDFRVPLSWAQNLHERANKLSEGLCS
jgi:predicted metal-dependent phosphoesterase TrpH